MHAHHVSTFLLAFKMLSIEVSFHQKLKHKNWTWVEWQSINFLICKIIVLLMHSYRWQSTFQYSYSCIIEKPLIEDMQNGTTSYQTLWCPAMEFFIQMATSWPLIEDLLKGTTLKDCSKTANGDVKTLCVSCRKITGAWKTRKTQFSCLHLIHYPFKCFFWREAYHLWDKNENHFLLDFILY